MWQQATRGPLGAGFIPDPECLPDDALPPARHGYELALKLLSAAFYEATGRVTSPIHHPYKCTSHFAENFLIQAHRDHLQDMSQSKNTTITVHYLADSRAQRILWLLEELEIPYEVKRYERVNMLAPPELCKVHPLGKSPVITDGDLTVAESGAIVEYIMAKYAKGKLQPPESGWMDNMYFSHYADGTLMPLLVWKLILTKTPEHVPLVARPIGTKVCEGLIAQMVDNRLEENIGLIEEQLKKHPGGWFAGGSEPTTADFMMLFPMEVFSSRSPKPVPESFNAYVRMIHDRPAYKRALEKGGSYAYAEL